MNALVTSEIRKITTLNFWWALALAPIAVGVFASAITVTVSSTADEFGGIDIPGGPGAIGLYFAAAFAALFAGVFGAVNAGTEFRHRTITTTFLTAQGRDRVLAAKLLVTALFGLIYGLVVQIAGVVFLLIFDSRTLVLGGGLFAAIAANLFVVVVWTLIGAGLGLLMKSPTWSAIALVAWFPLGEGLMSLILAGLGIGGASFVLPLNLTVTTMLTGQLDDAGDFVTWPLAPILLLVWPLLIVGTGVALARTRDID